jgi:hypothetical protein
MNYLDLYLRARHERTYLLEQARKARTAADTAGYQYGPEGREVWMRRTAAWARMARRANWRAVRAVAHLLKLRTHD